MASQQHGAVQRGCRRGHVAVGAEDGNHLFRGRREKRVCEDHIERPRTKRPNRIQHSNISDLKLNKNLKSKRRKKKGITLYIIVFVYQLILIKIEIIFLLFRSFVWI